MITDKREMLLVEFGVEKTVRNNEYPIYEEKYLLYNGDKIPYKAILKNGKLMAIVSRAYRLIPNEKVLDIVKRVVERSNGKYKIDAVYDLARKIIIYIDGEDAGAVVRNSIDGTWSLRADILLYVDGGKSIIGYGGNQIFRKHIGDADMFLREMDKAIETVIKKSGEIKYALANSDVMITRADLKDLAMLIPQKYLKKIKRDLLFNEKIQIYRAYSDIAAEIWKEYEIGFDRKFSLYDMLNKWTFMKVEWIE